MEDNNYTYYDDFLYHIDLSIETGNIKYIKDAIIKYKENLDQYYIDWGTRIIVELTQEAIEEIKII